MLCAIQVCQVFTYRCLNPIRNINYIDKIEHILNITITTNRAQVASFPLQHMCTRFYFVGVKKRKNSVNLKRLVQLEKNRTAQYNINGF